MRAFKVGLIFASMATLGACGASDTLFTADNGALAYTRFVNAVSDTGGMDWRFVDVVENSPVAFNLTFRGTFPGAGYQATGAGSRHLRIFQAPIDYVDPNKSTPTIVSTVFFDTTFNFVAGSHYTIIAAGNERAGSATPAKLYIVQDDFTDPGASIAVRVFNANAGASIDVYGSATGGTSALPSSPLAAGVGDFTATKYITAATGALSLRVTASGSTALPAMIDAAAPAGAAADRVNNLTAVGGSTIAGSAFTAFFFPAAVPGSLAAVATASSGPCPTTRCTTPGAVFMVDRYPPSGF